MCSPCAVTVHDQDCLMDPRTTVVFWTANLDADRAIRVLERAIERVRAYKAEREGKER
jgi:hypothetical protein